MATIPDILQTAFQEAFDAALLVATLSAQQASIQTDLQTCIASLAAAMADRDIKEVTVLTVTRELLGGNSIPPIVP